jgi:nucleotide-binding universal stress UspA family protein
MFRLERILLPVDFSERSSAAARYVHPLACRFQSEVTMLYALSHPSYEFNTEAFEAMLPEQSELAEDELDSFGAAELAGLHTRRLVVLGDPAMAIVDYTRHEKMDLIVMSTHGYGPFRRFLLGSTTAKVLHDIECPVLTGTHLDEIPERGSIHYHNVVCAVDLGPNSLGALRWAAGLAQMFESRLFLVHAIPSLAEAQGEYFRSNSISPLPAAALQEMTALQKEAGTNAIPIVVGGEIVKAVSRQARELSAGLLVIGRSTSGAIFGRLRTQAYGLIRGSPCPVVSI